MRLIYKLLPSRISVNIKPQVIISLFVEKGGSAVDDIDDFKVKLEKFAWEHLGCSISLGSRSGGIISKLWVMYKTIKENGSNN